MIRSATKEYDTSVAADITLVQIPCGFRYCVTPGSLSPAVFQRPLTSSIALFPRAPLLELLPGRPPSLLLLLLLLLLLPASLPTLRSPSSKASAVFLHVSLYAQPSPFLSHSPPRPSREPVVRGHLVAWLLGYSVTDRGGTRREKRNRKNPRPLKVHSRKVLGYFGSVRRSIKNWRLKKRRERDWMII